MVALLDEKARNDHTKTYLSFETRHDLSDQTPLKTIRLYGLRICYDVFLRSTMFCCLDVQSSVARRAGVVGAYTRAHMVRGAPVAGSAD